MNTGTDQIYESARIRAEQDFRLKQLRWRHEIYTAIETVVATKKPFRVNDLFEEWAALWSPEYKPVPAPPKEPFLTLDFEYLRRLGNLCCCFIRSDSEAHVELLKRIGVSRSFIREGIDAYLISLIERTKARKWKPSLNGIEGYFADGALELAWKQVEDAIGLLADDLDLQIWFPDPLRTAKPTEVNRRDALLRRYLNCFPGTTISKNLCPKIRIDYSRFKSWRRGAIPRDSKPARLIEEFLERSINDSLG